LYSFAFLSKPAASPTGFGNFIPNNSVSRLGLFKQKNFEIRK
jgi:hypothetical protein